LEQLFILGVGALGSLFAASLHRSGTDPMLIVRDPDKAANISQSGIICDGKSYSISACASQQLSKHSISYLLLCTKAHDSLSALSSIASAMRDDICIVCLQNGIGQHQQIHQHFPNASIFAALCTEGVTRTGAGNIVHAGIGYTDIGHLYGPVRPLPKILFNHALEVNFKEDIAPALWRKLAINGAINGLTVVHNCRNGELIQRTDVYNELVAIVAEIHAILIATGFRQASQDLLEQVVKVCKSTAMNTSSMLQDFRANRPSEREYVYGTLLNEANNAALNVPLLEKLNLQLQRRESL